MACVWQVSFHLKVLLKKIWRVVTCCVMCVTCYVVLSSVSKAFKNPLVCKCCESREREKNQKLHMFWQPPTLISGGREFVPLFFWLIVGTCTYPQTVRLDKETPARKAMELMFYERSNKTFRERKRATNRTSYLKSWYKEDQKESLLFSIGEIKSETDLHNSGTKARNKNHWKVVQASYSNTAIRQQQWKVVHNVHWRGGVQAEANEEVVVDQTKTNHFRILLNVFTTAFTYSNFIVYINYSISRKQLYQ